MALPRPSNTFVWYTHHHMRTMQGVACATACMYCTTNAAKAKFARTGGSNYRECIRQESPSSMFTYRKSVVISVLLFILRESRCGFTHKYDVCWCSYFIDGLSGLVHEKGSGGYGSSVASEWVVEISIQSQQSSAVVREDHIKASP